MKWLCIVLFVSLHAASFAQTTAEWLKQKKTRIKYLTQQVAALEVYLVDLKKGYRTVRNGLGVINDLKKGDFSIHSDYFRSLSAVDPRIRNSDRVQGIFTLQKEIIKLSAAMRPLLSSPFLQSSEKEYITSVLNNVLEKGSQDLDALSFVITSGTTEMDEEGRMDKIHSLYGVAGDRYVFLQHFEQDIQLLLRSRSREKQAGATMHSLYGLIK